MLAPTSAIIGAGLFVRTAAAIADRSGPSVTLAFMLAGVGLYGVTAYTVARRRMEIGIRMALGADSMGVVTLVLSRVAILVGAGLLVGVVTSLWASRFVAALLYELEPRDPAMMTLAAVTLAVTGVVAGSMPAYRAAHIDPADILRDT